jgi:hypothetical protein
VHSSPVKLLKLVEAKSVSVEKSEESDFMRRREELEQALPLFAGVPR